MPSQPASWTIQGVSGTHSEYASLQNGCGKSTSVPRALHAELGTKLKRPLGTDRLAAANVLKWQVVAELKAIIPEARRPRSARS